MTAANRERQPAGNWIFSWLWLLNGLGLGIYGYGFWSYQQAGFAVSVPFRFTSWLVAAMAAGLGLAWLEYHGMQKAGEAWAGMTPAETRRWWAASSWPYALLGLGPLFYPLLARWGAHLHLDVLGNLQFPAQSGFVKLPPTGYLYLLWVGPWFTLAWFLKWILGVQ